MAAIPSGEPGTGAKPGRPELWTTAAKYTVRPVQPGDRERWGEVYAQYNEHYGVPVRVEHQDLIWSWLMDSDHQLEGWVALDQDGVIRAVAHIRPFIRPLAGSVGGFLDDLVVDRGARRSGAVDAMMLALAQIAADRNWTVMRWITADDNHRARMVYDRYATRTMWLTYDMAPDEAGSMRPEFADRVSRFTVRPPEPSDVERWRHLYAQFAEHYTVPVDAQHQELVWSWVMDPGHPLDCLLAIDEAGVAQGLAHFRPFTRPLMGGMGCFLDDLLVDKAARRSGAADALLNALRQQATVDDWMVVRWITADDNYRAKKVYDFYGTRTMWVTYDMEPGPLPAEMKGILQ
jgi:ribosomal protein S18 acetylase RimI-like enzyme